MLPAFSLARSLCGESKVYVDTYKHRPPPEYASAWLETEGALCGASRASDVLQQCLLEGRAREAQVFG